jgi:hypothetical protein
LIAMRHFNISKKVEHKCTLISCHRHSAMGVE